MRTLFVHQSFPGQYRHLAVALAKRPGHEVVGLGERQVEALPGVRAVSYCAPAGSGTQTHRYVKPLEAAVRRGQAAARAAVALREEGFRPDLVCCHPGWGDGLFLRDVFPEARFLYYFEYYYAAEGADVGFDRAAPASLDEAARVHLLNANHLLALQAADWGHTATQWQRSRFPSWAQERITVGHEGINTDLHTPDALAQFRLPDGRVLTRADEVVTYAARGLEPYRGFPTFLRALPELLRRRPRAQVVVAGEDAAFYGPPPPGGGTWRAALLAELGRALDLSRVHFTGHLPHDELRRLFQVSAAHAYLSRPFILSWSLLEAMSCGCPVIGSATPTVQEVVREGETGRLFDFHNAAELSATIVATLEDVDAALERANAARAEMVRRFDLRRVCLPAGLALLDAVAAGRLAASPRAVA